MSAHTPGPWVWTDDTPSGEPVVGLLGGLAQVRMHEASTEQAVPNARLMAAAPDLLEVLEDIVTICQASQEGRELLGTFLAKAMRAIRKAKGEGP